MSGFQKWLFREKGYTPDFAHTRDLRSGDISVAITILAQSF